MGCGALAAVISIKSGALVGGRRGMISIPSSSSFPVGNSITRLITSCVCRNGQQMANARAPALIDARNLAPAKRRPDHYFLFLSLSLLSFSPCFLFFLPSPKNVVIKIYNLNSNHLWQCFFEFSCTLRYFFGSDEPESESS